MMLLPDQEDVVHLADSAPRREREDDEAIPTDYVPYNPIEKPNDEPDNSTDFDDDI